MGTGAVTAYIDVAQIAIYVFWLFFLLLVLYLRQEDRREGYPLERDMDGKVKPSGFFFIPEPKTFKLPHGGEFKAPNDKRDTRKIKAERVYDYPGYPLEPTGNPLKDGVGPASWAERADEPDMTFDNKVKIRPMRNDGGHVWVAPEDPDPRGMTVLGADGDVAGEVTDLWVDHAEMMIRYYEVKLAESGRSRPRLLPANCVRMVDGKIHVNSILAEHFADVPRTASPDQVTLLEEDKIMGYYAGGRLYATPERSEPII